MKIERTAARLATVFLVTSCLTACSTFFGPDVAVRPVERISTDASHDMRYDSAVSAIRSRDYGRALEYLQLARKRNPDDVRVLNALGVVYDKLGRFDLSGRYYAQAAAVEPQSRIVAANMAYSHTLQGLMMPSVAGSPALNSVADAAPSAPVVGVPKATAVAVAGSDQASVRLDLSPPEAERPPLAPPAPVEPKPLRPAVQPAVPPFPVPGAIVRRAIVLTGYPLVIANVAGRRDMADPVRRRLAALGWTVARTPVDLPSAQKTSIITYPGASLVAAKALARTVPFPVGLKANSCHCGGLTLALGTDFTGWKTARAIHPARQGISLAAIVASESKGVH